MNPAEEEGELWLVEAEPVTRVGLAYLALRPGDEDAAEAALDALSGPIRRRLELVPGDEAPAEDGPTDGDAWYLRVTLVYDRDPLPAQELYAALETLAPALADGRLLVGCGAWVDELRVRDGALSRRRELPGVDRLGHFLRRVDAEPEDAALRRLTARLHREAASAEIDGDQTSAGAWLDIALKLAPDDAEAWLLRARLAHAREDLAGQREAHERAIACSPPGSPRRLACHLALAQLHLDGKDFAAAAEHLAAAAALPDAPVDVHHRLGLALQELGRHEEAAAAYRRSVAARPQRASGSKLNLGNTHAARKEWAAALACYDAAIAEEPKMALAWGGRGQALRNLGRNAEAGVALARAVALDPSFHQFYLEQANLYFADGARAVALCDEALKRNPDCAYSWSTRGSALNNLGRHAEAHECYTRSIALDPTYGHPWYCRACTHALQGEPEQALAAAIRAVELDPSWRAAMAGEADLASLRADPRFRALLRG